MESSSNGEELLLRCVQGDESALAEFISLYEGRVYRFAWNMAGDPALADEATVATFFRVWRECRRKRMGTSLEAWLFRIVQRQVLDLQRARRRWWRRMFAGAHRSEEDSTVAPWLALAESEQQQRNASALHAVMSTLKEEDRALLHLYYFEDRNLREIAEIQSTTREAAKMRLMRLRQRLARELEHSNDD